MQLSYIQTKIQYEALKKVAKSYEKMKELNSNNLLLKHMSIVTDIIFYNNYKKFIMEFARTEETTFETKIKALENYSSCLEIEVARIKNCKKSTFRDSAYKRSEKARI